MRVQLRTQLSDFSEQFSLSFQTRRKFFVMYFHFLQGYKQAESTKMLAAGGKLI